MPFFLYGSFIKTFAFGLLLYELQTSVFERWPAKNLQTAKLSTVRNRQSQTFLLLLPLAFRKKTDYLTNK